MRSGTTLLGNMLHGGARARHPELSFAPDTVTDLRDLTPIAASETGQALPLMNAHVSTAFIDRWAELARTALPVFKSKVLSVAPAPGASVYGGKLTGLLPEILALAKLDGLDVKTVVLERDPRDIFASALKRYGEGPESAALAFMNASLSLDYRDAQMPNTMRVSYERLVTYPRETLNEVLRFIGLDSERYDWAALEGGLISNSSFSGIGPNDLVAGSGLKPSIGRHASLDAFHIAALAEFFETGRRGGLETRLQLYDRFLPEVISVGNRYGYAMDGLKAAAKRRVGIIVPLVFAARATSRKASEKLQVIRYSAQRILRRR
jgi:hypothetical protein